MNEIIMLVAISLCAASISFTVTISGIFENTRQWIYNKSPWFGQLITCPWCFGHYIVAIIVILAYLFNNVYIEIFNIVLLDLLFTIFTIIGLMGLWHKILLTAYDPVMKIKAQREIDKLKKLKLEKEIQNEQ